jgi:predicted aspartyl protease
MREEFVKFELVKGIIIVPVYINQQGPFKFALDTGASGSILTSSLAKKLAIKELKGATALALGAGGPISIQIGIVDSLCIGHFKLRNVKVAITDISTLEEKLGTKLDGIVGYDILKDSIITIDYPSRRLRLMPASRRA